VPLQCPGCDFADLDMSRGLFEFFADPSAGVIHGTWAFQQGSNGGSGAQNAKKAHQSHGGSHRRRQGSLASSRDELGGTPASADPAAVEGTTASVTALPSPPAPLRKRIDHARMTYYDVGLCVLPTPTPPSAHR
jgi:hypothetical protein